MNPLGWLSEGKRVEPEGQRYWLIAVLALPLALFEIWLAFWGLLPPLAMAMAFVTITYPIAFLSVTASRSEEMIRWWDYLLALLSWSAGVYLLFHVQLYEEWMGGLDEFSAMELGVASLYLLLTLELLHRCVGPGLSLVVGALLLYVFFGDRLSGTFSHQPLNFAYFAEEMIISVNGGIFGQPIQVAANYAFLFVLFGRLLQATGGGQFFFDLAAAIGGRGTGGVAKVAVVSSALFGTLSGSPAADVMTTGSITIPMMKKLGYRAQFAGAVEAVASTGGSLLPPVMGAVVFLMAEFTGIPYASIAWSSLGVALLFYFSVYLQVHLHSQKLGLLGLDESMIPGFGRTLLGGWQYLVPLVVLVGFLGAGYSAAWVAASAAVSMILVSWLRRETAITPKKFVEVTVTTCASLAPLVAAVAAAGLVIGGLNMTGLAGKMSTLIFGATEGMAWASLLMAMLVTVLLGMGMPVVAAYALVAVLVAPALIQMGFEPLQAHFFLVYYSVLSAITPPVAIACYVASSIADVGPMQIATQALRLGMIAFMIPMVFVYQPALLMQGSWGEVVWVLAVAAFAIYLIAPALEGWHRGRLSWPLRLYCLAAGLAAFVPHVFWQLAGVAAGVLFILGQKNRRNPD